MDFEDLPADFADRPLTDPDLASGVVDLVTTERDRMQRCLTVLLCDDAGRMLQPLVISPVPRHLSVDEAARMLANLADIADHAGAGGTILAVGTPTGGALRHLRVWEQLLARPQVQADLRLIGFFHAFSGGTRHIPLARRAA